MYHHLSECSGKGLTIGKDDFEKQCAYLVAKQYKTYHFSELEHLKVLSHKKSIILTFDDGYVSQLKYAIPILDKYQLKATFFIPMGYIGKEDRWNSTTMPIMDIMMLKSLNPNTIELAYHSYAHKRYDELTPEEVKKDTQQAFSVAESTSLPIASYLAYPYGKYPKNNPEKEEFFELLTSFDMTLGFRIGNRINRFPFAKPFEVQRIDVKGEWSLRKFKRCIRFGAKL